MRGGRGASRGVSRVGCVSSRIKMALGKVPRGRFPHGSSSDGVIAASTVDGGRSAPHVSSLEVCLGLHTIEVGGLWWHWVFWYLELMG